MPRITDRLFKRYALLTGAQFYGYLTTAAVSSTKDIPPFRVMYVRLPCFVKAGDTIIGYNGEKMVLMEHPSDHNDCKSFKVAFTDRQVAWERQVKSVDPVAKVARDMGYSDMGPLFVNFEAPEFINFQKFTDIKYKFVTGQDVRVDDKVDGLIVRTVVEVLGVKIVHAS